MSSVEMDIEKMQLCAEIIRQIGTQLCVRYSYVVDDERGGGPHGYIHRSLEECMDDGILIYPNYMGTHTRIYLMLRWKGNLEDSHQKIMVWMKIERDISIVPTLTIEIPRRIYKQTHAKFHKGHAHFTYCYSIDDAQMFEKIAQDHGLSNQLHNNANP